MTTVATTPRTSVAAPGPTATLRAEWVKFWTVRSTLWSLAAMFVLGAGSSGLAFLIYYTLNAEIGPSRASIVAYIAPVFSVLYGVTLLDEELTIGIIAGLALILLGSWLAADGRVPRRRRSRQAALADSPA
jgi:drug/metabolite transporter (DMT)-like permease